MWGLLPQLPSPDTHTVVIIDILLRTRAAMHTTIGLALEMNPADFTNWPPGNIGHYDSLWCQHATQNRFLYSLIITSIFLACYHVAKNEKMCFCGGPCSAEHAEHAQIRLCWERSHNYHLLDCTSVINDQNFTMRMLPKELSHSLFD